VVAAAAVVELWTALTGPLPPVAAPDTINIDEN
jgi:hypothetical protein